MEPERIICLFITLVLVLLIIAVSIRLLIKQNNTEKQIVNRSVLEKEEEEEEEEQQEEEVRDTNSWPFIVAVIIHQNKSEEFYCAGVILNPRWVLTTGQCAELIQKSNLKKAYVKNKLEQIKSKILSVLIHGNYNNETYHTDVSLLYVQRELPLSSDLRITYNKCSLTEKLVGFGYVNGVQEDTPPIPVYISLQSRNHCKLLKNHKGENISTCRFCVKLPKDGKNICHFDMGLPLINANRCLIGIVSWGKSCSDTHSLVYTNISYVADWIHNIIKPVSWV